MRISDWSSDVCSSDLIHAILPRRGRGTTRRVVEGHRRLTRRARLNGPHISGKGAVTHYLIGKANRLCPTTMLRMVPLPQGGGSSAHHPKADAATSLQPRPDRKSTRLNSSH